MNIDYSDRFQKSYRQAPVIIQKKFSKQIHFLKKDLRYPSLQAKKYDEATCVWQARVDRDWRFYFIITQDTYYLVDIIAHPK